MRVMQVSRHREQQGAVGQKGVWGIRERQGDTVSGKV